MPFVLSRDLPRDAPGAVHVRQTTRRAGAASWPRSSRSVCCSPSWLRWRRRRWSRWRPCAVGMVLGSLVAGSARTLRCAPSGSPPAPCVVAFVCCLPWSLTFVQAGARWSILAGAVGSPRDGGRGPAAAPFRRRARSVPDGSAGGSCSVPASSCSWPARRGSPGRRDGGSRRSPPWPSPTPGSVGWLGAGGGATLVLLAPAACCLAGAVGLGVAAFEVDLARSRFGWRQNLSVAAALCLVVGLFPTLVSSVDGRSSLPSIGFDQILGWTAAGNAARGYDVLWLGDPASVPAPVWQVRRGLAFAVSVDGLPDGRRLWPSAESGARLERRDGRDPGGGGPHRPPRLRAGAGGHPLCDHAGRPAPRPCRACRLRRRSHPRRASSRRSRPRATCASFRPKVA